MQHYLNSSDNSINNSRSTRHSSTNTNNNTRSTSTSPIVTTATNVAVSSTTSNSNSGGNLNKLNNNCTSNYSTLSNNSHYAYSGSDLSASGSPIHNDIVSKNSTTAAEITPTTTTTSAIETVASVASPTGSSASNTPVDSVPLPNTTTTTAAINDQQIFSADFSIRNKLMLINNLNSNNQNINFNTDDPSGGGVLMNSIGSAVTANNSGGVSKRSMDNVLKRLTNKMKSGSIRDSQRTQQQQQQPPKASTPQSQLNSMSDDESHTENPSPTLKSSSR